MGEGRGRLIAIQETWLRSVESALHAFNVRLGESQRSADEARGSTNSEIIAFIGSVE